MEKRVEQEYFDLLQREITKSSLKNKVDCEDCQRSCGRSPEETVECLANLMTLEYLLDHN